MEGRLLQLRPVTQLEAKGEPSSLASVILNSCDAAKPLSAAQLSVQLEANAICSAEDAFLTISDLVENGQLFEDADGHLFCEHLK